MHSSASWLRSTRPWLDDARWPETSALIDEVFGAKGSVLTSVGVLPNCELEFLFWRSYYRGVGRPEWYQEYFRDYYAEDERLPRLGVLPDSKIVRVADLFSEQELKTSRTYNEVLARFDGQNGLMVRLDGPSGSHIVWGIADPVDASGWSSWRIDMIGRVFPHLRQYVSVRSALVDAGALGRSLTELLGTTRTGVIQLDRSGRIVEANDLARNLLRRNEGLSDHDGALRTSRPEDNDRLQDLLARAMPRFGGQGASGSMLVRRPSLLPRFALHVKPVTSRELDHRPRRVAALVLIVDPVEQARIDPGFVEAALGLSPAETEGRGAARRGPDRPPDRGEDGPRIQHGAYAPEAYLRQARGVATVRGGAARVGAVETAGVPRLGASAAVLRACGREVSGSARRRHPPHARGRRGLRGRVPRGAPGTTRRRSRSRGACSGQSRAACLH